MTWIGALKREAETKRNYSLYSRTHSSVSDLIQECELGIRRSRAEDKTWGLDQKLAACCLDAEDTGQLDNTQKYGLILGSRSWTQRSSWVPSNSGHPTRSPTPAKASPSVLPKRKKHLQGAQMLSVPFFGLHPPFRRGIVCQHPWPGSPSQRKTEICR